MRIERFGIGRICTELQFKNVFKFQGYVEVLDGVKEVKRYKIEELRELAKKNGIKNYWSKKEESLIRELKLKEV